MGQVFKGAPPYFSPYIRYRNSVIMPIVGNGAPTNGTAGTGVGKAGPGSLYVDYASGTWYVNTNTKASPTWTAGTTLSGAISGTTGTFSGAITATTITGSGAILSSSATTGSGYKTGAGGAVTQDTDRTTGVTIDTPCGAITLVSAAGSTTPATFTVTCAAVAATDTVIVNQKSGTDLYEIFVTHVAAGSFKITSFTTGGTTTEQPVFSYAIIKAVAA